MDFGMLLNALLQYQEHHGQLLAHIQENIENMEPEEAHEKLTELRTLHETHLCAETYNLDFMLAVLKNS